MSLINKKDKILIAGSEGMVGSAILRLLSARRYQRVFCPSRKDLNLLDQNTPHLI